MRVYVGSTRSSEFVRALRAKDIGRVNHPESVFPPYDWEKWFADNGAYSAWLRQRPFDEDAYVRYLDKLESMPPPQFGVLPDIVADGMRSLDFSMHWLGSGLLPDWKWYLAVQDGMTPPYVEPLLDMVDGLFIGGTLRFKTNSWMWVQMAHRKDKPVHFGRAGVHNRIHYAHNCGCDSCDSAFPLWTKERFYRFVGWVGDNGHYDPESCKQEGLFDVFSCGTQDAPHVVQADEQIEMEGGDVCCVEEEALT